MGDLNKKNNVLTEELLQYSWNCLPPKTELYAISGEKVVVIFTGVWNFEEGPDFLNAKLSIDGKIFSGDIEVHRYLKDWVKHGHANDCRYSNVILHVLGDYSVDCFPAGRIIPDILTLIFPEDLTKVIPDKSIKYPYGYCAAMFANFSDKELFNFFVEAGLKRFYEKSSLYTTEILEIGAHKTLLKYFFDSCGYKNNRQEFLELYNRFSSYNINSQSPGELKAILWGESGLLPDTIDSNLSPGMQNFITHTWNIWWKLRESRKEPINWNLSCVRPLNTPCRRVAAAAVFLDEYGLNAFDLILSEIKKIEDSNDIWKALLNIFVCKDALWDYYSNPFHMLKKKSAVLGKGRALDILVNVILPLLYAYSEINNIENIKHKALKVWKSIPPLQLNIILKISSQRWLIPENRAKQVFSSAASQQGAIYIHREFCELKQMDCVKCPIGRKVKG